MIRLRFRPNRPVEMMAALPPPRPRDPEGWRPVVLVDGLPDRAGPYLVGYGDDWQEIADWDEAWQAHVVRGSTRYASHLLVREDAP